MLMISRFLSVLRNPLKIFSYLATYGFFNYLPDKIYLKPYYRGVMGKKLNLKNPVSFNEKLQWLKLNDRNNLYTKLVDKYEVREFVEKTIGKEYLVPLIGVWEKFEDIDISNLPDQFILKCTHDSGGVIICRDKSKFDFNIARKKINKSLRKNFFYFGREWPYKEVSPRIICEHLITSNSGATPNDYKFHCFNGKPDNVMVCTERDSGKPRYHFFDDKWNLLKYNIQGEKSTSNNLLDKPVLLDEMFLIAEKLSKSLPFVRVDLYCEDNKIYFGELTFFPQSGFDSKLFIETDILFGEKLNLIESNNRMEG